MPADDQSLIGSILPTVHFQKIDLESGGNTNAMLTDNPHIMDKNAVGESAFMDAQALDQSHDDPTNSLINPSTWDATADINDEADTMTTTISLVLKDRINTLSQNSMWIFSNLFLDYVKVVVVQMSHYEYATSEAYVPEAYYESKLYKWLAEYNRKKFEFSNNDVANWYTFEAGVNKPEYSNIKDYRLEIFTLREVIESGMPQILDVLKENPDSQLDITDPSIQKKITSLLLEGNKTFNYSESSSIQVENSPGKENFKVLNIPFQIKFNIGKEDPLGLTYLAFSYFDIYNLQLSQNSGPKDTPGTFPDINFFPVSPANVPFDLRSYPVLMSTPNVKEVIKNGSVNKTDVIFLLDNGDEYYGNIKMVDPENNLVINAAGSNSQFLDNGYNENPGDYTLLGLNFYTDASEDYAGIDPPGYYTPFASLREGDQPLTVIKKAESIINDFRIFKKLEQIQVQVSNFSNKLVGQNALHAYNKNISIKNDSFFSDLWLSLGAGYHGEQSKDMTSNFMFGVNIGALLESQSEFSWFYQIDNLYENEAYIGVQSVIEHIRQNTKIKGFQILRRSVKELNLNPDNAQDRFEIHKSEDPDPHTGGSLNPITFSFPIPTTLYSTLPDTPSHQKATPPFTDFYLDHNTGYLARHGVAETSNPKISWDQLGPSFYDPLKLGFYTPSVNSQYETEIVAPITTNQKSKLLFISGVDDAFPANASKRFQYGVRFKVQDGVRFGLVKMLDDLVERQKALNAIESDIKMLTFHNGKNIFPIVDYKTNQFVSEYTDLENTNAYLLGGSSTFGSGIENAVHSYLTVVSFFDFDVEIEHVGFDSLSFKFVNKIQSDITHELRNNIINAISPINLGSAKLFLDFKRSYDQLLSSLRSLLKQQKPSKNQIGAGDAETDISSVGYATQKNLIEVEYFFPQTLMSPSVATTGYNYIPLDLFSPTVPVYSDSVDTDFKSITRSNFDQVVDMNCIKYFAVDFGEDIPEVPENSPRSFYFGTPEDSKHNFLTPSRVVVDGKGYDLIPEYDNETNNPFLGNFTTSNINYTKAMLHVLARVENSKAEYPKIFNMSDAYNDEYDLRDSYIASQILAARSCILEGGSLYESYIIPYDDITADPNYEPGYIILPAFEGTGKIEHLGINPDIIPEIEEQIDDMQIRAKDSSNLIFHLVALDEFKYIFNMNKNNFSVLDAASITPSNDNLLEKLRIKYDVYTGNTQGPGFQPFQSNKFRKFVKHRIPNSIKYMFTVANSNGFPAMANPYFKNILELFLNPTTATENIDLTKEELATLYFNFFNIVKVEYLSGFGRTESGKIIIKDAQWKPLSSRYGEADTVLDNAGLGNKLLCRLVPYDDNELINSQTKYLDLPILNEYFFITL